MSLPWACSKSTPTTPIGTDTPTPSATPTNWAAYTPTNTPTVTSTGTPTFTATSTATVTFTLTFTSTSTGTIPTSTFTFTFTSTNTLTDTATSTNTNTPTNTATPTFTFTPINTFSTPPPTPTGITWNVPYPPNGLTANSVGTTVYVAEGAGSGLPGVIQLFSSAGASLGMWTTIGGGVPFGQPNGVAINAAGTTIYVVDTEKNAVFSFDPNGNAGVSWAGDGTTNFAQPEGIAVDPAGNVYVADTGNDRVLEFNSDGSSTINTWSAGLTPFILPSAVAIGVNAGVTSLYVAEGGTDTGSQFIQVATTPTSWSNFATLYGSDIYGITVDTSGNIYLADSGKSQVEIYDSSGSLLTAGPIPSNLLSPDGVILLGGVILVSDYAQNGLFSFTP